MLNAFRSSGKKKGSNILVWILLGLLIIGLTGFGLGGAVSGLASQNVARVGGEKVSRQDFVRGMFRQIDNFAQQTQQRLTMQQAQAFGLDRQVLSRLVTVAAMDGAASEMKLSVGDRVVGDQLLQSPAFQGLSGTFDQQAYEFFLDRQGLAAKDYEEELREELSRALLQSSVMAGTEMPDVMAETILAYLGEQRSFSYLVVTPAQLDGDAPTPTEDVLRGFHAENGDSYTIPETREISYAALRPADLASGVEVSAEDIQAEYEARSESYNSPETRLIDQISFLTRDDAEAARQRLESGDVTFVELAAEKGLSQSDITRGAVTRDELGSGARDAVFGTDDLGVVGPVETDLGPSLYRVSAIIAARETPLAEVEDDLRQALALDEARRRIADYIDPVQDLLASGATLAEIADETDLLLGEIGLNDLVTEGIGADANFRAEAQAAEIDEDRDLIDLADGGIAALRVTGIAEPRLQPFEDVRDQVESDWSVVEEQRRMTALAEELQAQLGEGRTLTAVAEGAGLSVIEELPRERGASLAPGLPSRLLAEVFELAPGGSTVLGDVTGVYLVQLDGIVPVDPEDETQTARRTQLDAALAQQLGNDIFLSYAQLLTDTAGVEVNEQLIRDTLAQYP